MLCGLHLDLWCQRRPLLHRTRPIRRPHGRGSGVWRTIVWPGPLKRFYVRRTGIGRTSVTRPGPLERFYVRRTGIGRTSVTGPGPLERFHIRRTIVARPRLPAPVGVDSGVARIDIPPNDFVVASGVDLRRFAALAFAARPPDIVVVHLAVYVVVAIQRVVIHAVIDHVPVDHHGAICVVHIDVGDVNVRARAFNPRRAAVPSMIKDAMAAPVAIVVQPCADKKAGSEKDGGPGAE